MTTTTAKKARYQRLEALDREMIKTKANKHDRVQMLINAAVSDGVCDEAHIIGTVANLGFNHGHVAKLLKEGVQPVPKWPEWGRAPDGKFFAPPLPETEH